MFIRCPKCFLVRFLCVNLHYKSQGCEVGLEFGVRFIRVRRVARARIRIGVGLGLGQRVSLTQTLILILTLGTRKIESQAVNSKPTSHTHKSH